MKKIFFTFLIYLLFSVNIAFSEDISNSKNNTFFSEISSIFKQKFEKIKNSYKINFLEIQFGGDIMLSRTVGALNKEKGYDRIFKNFNPNYKISKNTILFYNLESPFSENDNDFSIPTFIFKANPKNIQVLQELKGKNNMVLSLANNHISNAGGAGIETTIELLEKNDISHIGVGKEEPKFKKIFQNNLDICFSAYTYDGFLLYSKNKNGIVEKYFINKIEKEKIFSDLDEMKNKNCNFKIISLHWGEEYIEKPTEKQKKLAHEIIDYGADLILGHHSHILGEIENYKGKKIYYSLGNFIFDQDWGKTTNENGVDYKFDEKLGKNTVQTYIGNTFYHRYLIIGDKKFLIHKKNIKHRINFGELEKY